MTFLNASVDWFQGRRSGHMGADQYVAHGGLRDGQSTSGAFLWAKIDAERIRTAGCMVNAETTLLRKVLGEIADYVPSDTDVVELGPGTVAAFRNKTLPIISRLKSKNCVLVDESVMFLKQIVEAGDLGARVRIKPVVDDFFENEMAYLEGQTLVCSFGSTISNIINPISPDLPETALTGSLSTLARATNDGWLLIAFDSDQDSERIKGYFSKHALFQLNIFDRMAAELPIEGNFDPKAFDYVPEWIASSGQLAHIAVVSRDMAFTLGGTDIVLNEGQRLHIKNSYKFAPAFFEECCKRAGLSVVKVWSDSSPAKIYLLRKWPQAVAQRAWFSMRREKVFLSS